MQQRQQNLASGFETLELMCHRPHAALDPHNPHARAPLSASERRARGGAACERRAGQRASDGRGSVRATGGAACERRAG
eukprot:1367790-Prymnesium_polylepis.1